MDFLIVLLAICFAVVMATFQTFLKHKISMFKMRKFQRSNRRADEVAELVAELKEKIEKLHQLGQSDDYRDIYEKVGAEKVIESHCRNISQLGSRYFNRLKDSEKDLEKSLEITEECMDEAIPELKGHISFVEKMIADIERLGLLQKQAKS